MYGSQRKGLRSGGSAGGGGGGGGNEPTPGPSTQQNQGGGANLIQLLDDNEGSSDNDNEDGEVYGDMHKLVLQGMMAAGYLDAKGVKKLFQESCKQLKCKAPADDHQSPAYIQKVVREINERIKTYDMVIRSATCEITGGKFYVLLVTIEKQIMKLQTYFTKTELELFQKILDATLRKQKHFSIPLADCINMGGDMNVNGFTKRDAEDFVNRMISLQYFTKVSTSGDADDFEVTLGFRTIREFEPIFRECYQDCFTNCRLCKNTLLNGLQCTKCSTVVHRACFRRYIISCKICVTCKAPWKSEKSLVLRRRDGNVEATNVQSSQETSQTQGPSTSKRTRPIFTANIGIGDEVDMPILEPMVSPGSAGAAQSKSQMKNKKKRGMEATSSPPKESAVGASQPKKKPGPASSKHGGGRAKRVLSSESSDSD